MAETDGKSPNASTENGNGNGNGNGNQREYKWIYNTGNVEIEVYARSLEEVIYIFSYHGIRSVNLKKLRKQAPRQDTIVEDLQLERKYLPVVIPGITT